MKPKPMRPDLSRTTRNCYHYCSSAVPHWSFVQCLDCRPLLLLLLPPLDCAAAAAAAAAVDGWCDCSSSAESCSMQPRQNLRVRRWPLDLPADGLQRHPRWVSFGAGREVEEEHYCWQQCYYSQMAQAGQVLLPVLLHEDDASADRCAHSASFSVSALSENQTNNQSIELSNNRT